MKRALLLLLSIAALSATQAQTVTNVDYYQDGKQIVVTYSLDKQSDISVYCSTDGGKSYDPVLKCVTGDVMNSGVPCRYCYTPVSRYHFFGFRLASD